MICFNTKSKQHACLANEMSRRDIMRASQILAQIYIQTLNVKTLKNYFQSFTKTYCILN